MNRRRFLRMLGLAPVAAAAAPVLAAPVASETVDIFAVLEEQLREKLERINASKGPRPYPEFHGAVGNRGPEGFRPSIKPPFEVRDGLVYIKNPQVPTLGTDPSIVHDEPVPTLA